MNELSNSKIWNKNAFENTWELLDSCRGFFKKYPLSQRLTGAIISKPEHWKIKGFEPQTLFEQTPLGYILKHKDPLTPSKSESENDQRKTANIKDNLRFRLLFYFRVSVKEP